MDWKKREEEPVSTEVISKTKSSKLHHQNGLWAMPGTFSKKELEDINSKYNKEDIEINIITHFYKDIFTDDSYGIKSSIGQIGILDIGLNQNNTINYLGIARLVSKEPMYQGKTFYFDGFKPLGSDIYHADFDRIYWLANHEPILNTELEKEFLQFLELKPESKKSLESCLEHLTRDCPKYGNKEQAIYVPIEKLSFD